MVNSKEMNRYNRVLRSVLQYPKDSSAFLPAEGYPEYSYARNAEKWAYPYILI